MAQKAIREFDAKSILFRNWDKYFYDFNYNFRSISVQNAKELEKVTNSRQNFEWAKQKSLVVKPDMMFGQRGLNNLVFFKNKILGDVKLNDAIEWIKQKSSKEITLESKQRGKITHFIVEPFIKHKKSDEYYVGIVSEDKNDVIYISLEGGVDIEENWDSKITTIDIPVLSKDNELNKIIEASMPKNIPLEKKEQFVKFIEQLYRFYKDMHFVYFEINPLVVSGNSIEILDLVAKVDDLAYFLVGDKWGSIEFPTQFGQGELTDEEKQIKSMDEKSGSSLKLTILNPTGKVWTMVAGGGGSVVYADTIAEFLPNISDLANYGEYSGNPTTYETYFYAKTIIDLMTRHKSQKGADKILIIGGAIANFTDVANTFKGIIKAIEESANKLKEAKLKIYVRRGGPNYKTGLMMIKNAVDKLDIHIEVYGPDTHMTEIVKKALLENN